MYLLRNCWKELQVGKSNINPRGHIHPQNTLPKIMVSKRTTKVEVR